MARELSLGQLISDLREELRRANNPAASPDDTATLRRTINHVYRVLYYGHDWPFLKQMFPAIMLNAGQRHYDMPAGLDVDRILDVRVKYYGSFVPIERGITFDDYSDYDSDLDERSSPALKWDVRFTGTREQIEIWPVPDGIDMSLRFHGVYKCDPLVADTDRCRLEGELVVLYAAAELLPKDSPDKEAKLELARELLRLTKIRATSASGQVFQAGLGNYGASEKLNPRTTVRIGG